MKQGKAVEANENSTALPLGVEYEELSRNLLNNVEKKYENREDLRDNAKKFSVDMINDDKPSTSFLLIPGSALVNYEDSNHSTAPRPVVDGPWRSSDCWIGK